MGCHIEALQSRRIKMKTTFICMIAILFLGSVGSEWVAAQHKEINIGPFKRIQITNDVIVAYLPDWGNKWRYTNGTNIEITSYGQILCFRNGDNFQMDEKHAHYAFRAEITNESGFLYYTLTFDARSFGHGITTTNGIFKAKK